MTTTRASVTADFGTPTEVAYLDVSSWVSVCVAHDGSFLLLSTTTAYGTEIHASTSTNGVFSNPAPVREDFGEGALVPANGESMYLNGDAGTVFYRKNYDIGGNPGLYSARYRPSWLFAGWEPEDFSNRKFINHGDSNPVVTRDELTLYFSSQRAASGVEIMKSTRPSAAADETWTDPPLSPASARLAPINPTGCRPTGAACI